MKGGFAYNDAVIANNKSGLGNWIKLRFSKEVRKMIYKKLIFLITLIVTSMTFTQNAFAAQYDSGQFTWIGNHVNYPVTLKVVYIPEANSILIKGVKSNFGLDATYKFPDTATTTFKVDELKTVGEKTCTIGTFGGLIPDTRYQLYIRAWSVITPTQSRSVDHSEIQYFEMYTDPAIPKAGGGGILPLTVGVDTVTLKIDTMDNPQDTSYTIQRRTSSSSFVDLVTTQNLNLFSDVGLSANTNYYYRIRINAKSGRQYFSQEYSVTTLPDLSITYAEQAKISADKAAGYSWYTGTYGGASESVGNLAGYIRIPQYHGS